MVNTYFGGADGLIPRKLADHHTKVFAEVFNKALENAKVTINEIDLIAFAQGPGIGAPLSVGIAGAKYLAWKFDKKIIGVNHGYAHAKISEYLCKMKNPLVIYVSGGNTQIIVEENEGEKNRPGKHKEKIKQINRYRVLGETLDIGIGNLFDNFARSIKMEKAHGSELEKLAKKGKYVELPYTVKGMNLVFSGLLTAAEKKAESEKKEDVAFSIMETAFAMTAEVTERALFLTNKKQLVVCGGVAQNRRFQKMLREMCKEAKVKFGVAPDKFNRDNGTMIAYEGSLLYEKYGGMKIENCNPITNYRIDKMDDILELK
ncbi:tRNA (adenosine(37)-N6)-threonylcarbamoyltransferase complex transferase subunit TsaD [Candidatus Micrarchaeota archaeon]|nr:tRNA (adenosine(37)-N6)-threonylcarbamoyltransferase complex transferase subunit TsaD [Candidatus Micrarchaeota archaeon]